MVVVLLLGMVIYLNDCIGLCHAFVGMIVSIPNIAPHMRWLNYLSMIKYPYQAMLLLFFHDNPKTKGPFGGTVEGVIDSLELNEPPTFWSNIGVAALFYVSFIASGYFFLRFLYKEKR